MSITAPDRLVHLRQELKSWEQAFVTKNGRKPTRHDIKTDRQIAEKYRTFNKSRPAQARAQPCSTTPRKSRVDHARSPRVLVDKSVNINACTPRKSTVSTPRKAMPHTEQQVPSPTPVHVRYALGPTPQKDGHVLGLFDESPSVAARNSNGLLENRDDEAIAATPSNAESRMLYNVRHSRTPQSPGKRFFLDAFAGTPLKRKRDLEDIGTPASTKRTFATPAYLRGASAVDHTNDDITKSKHMVSRRKRGPVRSLSSIIANLRKNEDRRMDEEWEIMQEMEAEAASDDNVDNDNYEDDEVDDIENIMSRLEGQTDTMPVQAADFEVPDMPLGPDRPAMGEDDDDDDESTNEQAGRKVWKKKGLKRQTKRVNMKPVLHEPKKAAELAMGDLDLAAPNTGSEPQDGQHSKNDGTGIVKKALRKVNEAAHMNFRRLKIKNKNSKAGGRGRFGRR